MNNREIENMLNDILKFFKNEDYVGAKKYIETKKTKIIADKDRASEYIDDLVNDLK